MEFWIWTWKSHHHNVMQRNSMKGQSSSLILRKILLKLAHSHRRKCDLKFDLHSSVFTLLVHSWTFIQFAFHHPCLLFEILRSRKTMRKERDAGAVFDPVRVGMNKRNAEWDGQRGIVYISMARTSDGLWGNNSICKHARNARTTKDRERILALLPNPWIYISLL